jgi:murein DD-endopeptidase MepM/ murein hydrolase activator NlpD
MPVPPLRRPAVRAPLAAAVFAALAVCSPAIAAPCWSPPVTAIVVDPFREPACPWCPGNRGIEYGTTAGDAVLAVASGEVAFSGSVAGTRYVVVRHADGLRVTYGNLADTTLATGDRVARSAVVGHTAGRFHLGVRDGERYIDPAPMIGELRGVVRLIPSDGSEPAPAPPPRLTCATS